MSTSRHRASPVYRVGSAWMCTCGREHRIKTVRSHYGSQSPIRDKFGMAVWRASHGKVLDPERWRKWRERSK